MSDADMPWSSPPEGSSAGSDSAPSSTSRVPSSLPSVSPDEDLRAIFMQAAEEYYRKQEAEEEVAGAGSARGAIESEAIAPSAETGSPKLDGPKAPDFSDLFKHFEELERGAKEQIRNVVEKDEREAEAKAAVARGEAALTNAIVEGQARGAKTLDAIMQNAAVEAGYRQLEGQTNSGAAQHDRTEEAGWREYHQTEQLGLGQLDRSQTAGERQHESEERRRSSGMSL